MGNVDGQAGRDGHENDPFRNHFDHVPGGLCSTLGGWARLWGWLEFTGAAALRLFVKGEDVLLLFFRMDLCSHKCSDIVGALILREESLLAVCFESGGILRSAQNDNQRAFSTTCEATTHKAVGLFQQHAVPMSTADSNFSCRASDPRKLNMLLSQSQRRLPTSELTSRSEPLPI
jgi:hypothetical protein